MRYHASWCWWLLPCNGNDINMSDIASMNLTNVLAKCRVSTPETLRVYCQISCHGTAMTDYENSVKGLLWTQGDSVI